MQEMAQEELNCSHTSKVKEARSKAVEKTLSGTFCTRFESANNGLMTSPFQFMRRTPTEVAQNGALDEEIRTSIECRTQSFTLTDALARRALPFSWFARSVAKFICNKWKNNLVLSTMRGIYETLRVLSQKLHRYHPNHFMTCRSASMGRQEKSYCKSHQTSTMSKRNRNKVTKRSHFHPAVWWIRSKPSSFSDGKSLILNLPKMLMGHEVHKAVSVEPRFS